MSNTKSGIRLYQLEEEIQRAICGARVDPSSYVPKLQARMEHFRGTQYMAPELGGATAVATVEGASAVEDALYFLRKQAAVKPFVHEDEDCVSPSSQFSDEHPDLSSPRQGTTKHDTWCQFCWFGPANITAQKVVEDLIIDDGCTERKHRLAIFKPLYQSIEVQCRQKQKGSVSRLWCKFNFSMSTSAARSKAGRLRRRSQREQQLTPTVDSADGSLDRQISQNLSSPDGSLASEARSSASPSGRSRPVSAYGVAYTTSSSWVMPPPTLASTPGSQEAFFNTWPGVVHIQTGGRIHKGSTLRRVQSAGGQRIRPSVPSATRSALQAANGDSHRLLGVVQAQMQGVKVAALGGAREGLLQAVRA